MTSLASFAGSAVTGANYLGALTGITGTIAFTPTQASQLFINWNVPNNSSAVTVNGIPICGSVLTANGSQTGTTVINVAAGQTITVGLSGSNNCSFVLSAIGIAS